MLSTAGIENNFRLMIVQVRKQLENTLTLLDSPTAKLVAAIQQSDDYIDSQKSMIENKCYQLLSTNRIEQGREVDFVRAISIITVNLERIADYSANTARQVQHLADISLLQRFDYNFYFDRLFEGIDSIAEALFKRRSSLALRIGHIEDELDRLYRLNVQEIISMLRISQQVEDIITTLFILHYLERMGDSLKNIGEAIILATLGERLKLHQYRVLDDAAIAAPELGQPITDVGLASIWGTRSGVRIGTMEERTVNPDEQTERVIFKEGNPEKLQKERESLRKWTQIAPGLAPEVVEYQEQEQGAALLLQYLDGTTLQDIILNAEAEIVTHTLDKLEQLLLDIWTRTTQPSPANGDYMHQLQQRLDDVFRLHPALEGDSIHIGNLRVRSFSELLSDAVAFEHELPAPFSVFIHGDFNIDNIIFNSAADRLHFVDTHRSRQMDYVQDVSVFLVSNFRLPVFIPKMRTMLEAVTLRWLDFARRFAAQNNDDTFEARLALGLVRSFTTSTRFELNRRFARRMHQRAILLLNKLVAHHGQPWQNFKVPDGVLLY